MKMLKKCEICLRAKPVRSEFRKRGDGYRNWCRDCENEEKRAERKRQNTD